MAWSIGVGLTVLGAVALVVLAVADGSWELAAAAVIVVGFVFMLREVRDAADDVPSS